MDMDVNANCRSLVEAKYCRYVNYKSKAPLGAEYAAPDGALGFGSTNISLLTELDLATPSEFEDFGVTFPG
jgi:hypothetical protein